MCVGGCCQNMFVDWLKRLQPLRALPAWVRYGLTALIVLACLAIRYSLQQIEQPEHLPQFLMFMPAVIVASFLFDRGSGFFAVAFGALLGSYFFVSPPRSFALQDPGEIIGLVTFVVIGLLTASIIEALRHTVDRLHTTIDALGAAEEASRQSLSLMTEIMEGTPDPIFVKNRRSQYVHANAATANVFGTTKEQLIGRSEADFMPPDEAERVLSTDRQVMNTGRTLGLEEVVVGADGVARTYLTTKAPWCTSNGEVLGIIGVARDIHDRKVIEERLKTANAHKQLLLNDINHRVKNHLQTVSALLYASRQRAADEGSQEALDTAISQLQVLARVYDRLQLREGATTVDASEFIQALAVDLRATILSRRMIVLRCSADRCLLDSSHAVLLGLAINELVTNALKYAFPSARDGEIEISLRLDGDNMRLEVIDNGVGISPEAIAGRGRRLVLSFAHELGGTVDWHSGASGTRAVLTFPVRMERYEGSG
jgi:PAS domain S-box-containing protein